MDTFDFVNPPKRHLSMRGLPAPEGRSQSGNANGTAISPYSPYDSMPLDGGGGTYATDKENCWQFSVNGTEVLYSATVIAVDARLTGGVYDNTPFVFLYASQIPPEIPENFEAANPSQYVYICLTQQNDLNKTPFLYYACAVVKRVGNILKVYAGQEFDLYDPEGSLSDMAPVGAYSWIDYGAFTKCDIDLGWGTWDKGTFTKNLLPFLDGGGDPIAYAGSSADWDAAAGQYFLSNDMPFNPETFGDNVKTVLTLVWGTADETRPGEFSDVKGCRCYLTPEEVVSANIETLFGGTNGIGSDFPTADDGPWLVHLLLDRRCHWFLEVETSTTGYAYTMPNGDKLVHNMVLQTSVDAATDGGMVAGYAVYWVWSPPWAEGGFPGRDRVHYSDLNDPDIFYYVWTGARNLFAWIGAIDTGFRPQSLGHTIMGLCASGYDGGTVTVTGLLKGVSYGMTAEQNYFHVYGNAQLPLFWGYETDGWLPTSDLPYGKDIAQYDSEQFVHIEAWLHYGPADDGSYWNGKLCPIWTDQQPWYPYRLDFITWRDVKADGTQDDVFICVPVTNAQYTWITPFVVSASAAGTDHTADLCIRGSTA
jgi:hypothetical protein